MPARRGEALVGAAAAAARRGLFALALLSALGAGCCDCVDDPHDTSVATVVIVPDEVVVLRDRRFVLDVRLWDSEGHAVAVDPADPPTWSSSDNTGLTVDVSSGRFGQFTGTSPGSFTVTVQAGGREATASVTVTDGSATAGSDLITAPFSQPMANFALVSGSRGGGPAVLHEMHAFAGAAPVANLTGGLPAMVEPDGSKLPAGPGSVVMLSRQYEAGHGKPPWKAAPPDVVDFHESGGGSGTENVQLRAPVTITAHVWDATTEHNVDLSELAVANASLAASNLGVILDEPDDAIGLLVPGSAWVSDCLDPGAVMRLAAGPAETPFDASRAVLHVVYMTSTHAGTMSGTNWPVRGIGCNPAIDPARPARVIFLHGQMRSQSTLAHELGHVFGLIKPSSGHTLCLPGFDQSNLMWTSMDDTHTARREVFSLGQSFRVALGDWSWLNHGGFRTGTTYPCHVLDQEGNLQTGARCPQLSHPWWANPPAMGTTCP